MPIKKRTKSQRVGARGESAFRHIASSIGLLPTKVEEDFGIDFLCQIERDSTRAITDITGHLLGVAVRATTSHRGRIRLNRDDVETLLNCRFPVMIALVKLGTEPSDDQLYLRLIDGDFAIELAAFLSTAANNVSYTPGSFIALADASQLITKATSHGFNERIHLLLLQHGLSMVLPNARLQIQQSVDGQLSLIRTSDFLSQFDVSSEQAKNQLHAALFGSEKHFTRRMAQLQLRKEIWSSLSSLPEPVVIVGPIKTGQATLIVEGSSVRCEFEVRSGIDYTAYVHFSGFSIRMSEAKLSDGQMVHHITAEIDPDIDISYKEHKDLWNFLAECTPDRSWKREDWPGEGVPLEKSGDLYRFAWLAHYLRQTEGEISWPLDEWYLSDALSDEVLNALALAGLALAEPEFLSGVAITVLKSKDAEEVSVKLTVPACSNLPRGGLVLWLHAEGTALLKDEGIGGVNIRRIIRVTSEFVNTVFPKSSSKPELVIHSKWPTVALGPAPEMTTSNASSWGYETRLRTIG
jgi:hypothetical protein